MRRKVITNNRPINTYHKINDFKALLRYVTYLAEHKMGYPVSLLSYLGVINNASLGIVPGSLANVLLNNVGDPFKDSETSLMEVKIHEREVISILEKYYGLSKNDARGYVTSGGTEGNFAALWWSKRFLINMELDRLIKKDDEIKMQIKEEQDLMVALTKISMNDYQERLAYLQDIIRIKNLIEKNRNIVQQMLVPTVFFSKSTHYSIGKIAELLRLNIKNIDINSDGSIDLNNFKKELLFNLQAYPFSPVIVIANIGTTITGAIDDVPGIKRILDESQPKPDYSIHMDGALTGFVMPIIKPFGAIDNYFDALGVNTLAVSAHKFPGLSQPCGIILAKRVFFEKAFEKSERSIDYVGNILDVTITGSRSGLNVLMFYNALYTLGMDKGTHKLKKMVQVNIDNATYLYHKLISIFGQDRVSYPYHFNVMFPKPSMILAKKYQLMITGDTATICVLTNVTKGLIDQFIKDLILDIKEQNMDTTNDYTIVTLQSEHAKSAAELFAKCFCNSEPATRHLGIQYPEYLPFANEVIQKAIKEGMSKVAVDSHQHVFSLCVAEDLADPFLPKLTHYPKLRPIFALLNSLSAPFVKEKKFLKGKIVHIWISVVEPEHRGIGLSTKTDLACIELAARKGYDYAYAEFTNEISENVTHQFTVLKLCNRIAYDSFKMGEEYPFKGLKGGAASYVATIRPGARLDTLDHCYIIEEKYQ